MFTIQVSLNSPKITPISKSQTESPTIKLPIFWKLMFLSFKKKDKGNTKKYIRPRLKSLNLPMKSMIMIRTLSLIQVAPA